MGPGGYRGGVYRVGRGRGIPGVLPSCSGRGVLTAERAPEGPQGLEWVVSTARAFRHPGPPTPGPLVLPGPASLSWAPPSSKPASGPIRARFHDISLKVSRNGHVSPKYVEKACLSPYIQNELVKSPLEILRFPICLAFSHKELMAHFDPYT